jgi:SAM-dependent methyltransferase
MPIDKHRLATPIIRRFHDPKGFGGRVAGWVMGRRPSNVARSRWAVELLEVRSGDRVLELGCGPGVAVAALATRLETGVVVGVDRSDVMIGQARRRNARAVQEGRAHLVVSPVEDLPARHDAPFDARFDAALAINTVGFWPDPAARLAELRARLVSGARIALVSQPRCPGATAETSAAAATELTDLLARAGFTDMCVQTLALEPPAVCVLARN